MDSIVPGKVSGTLSFWRWLMYETKCGTQWPPKDSPTKCRGLAEKWGNMVKKKMRRKVLMSPAASCMVTVEGLGLVEVEKPTPAGLLWRKWGMG